MRNILSIAGKEVKGYFESPIAYLLLTIFSVLFGYFLYIYTQAFVVRGMEMQMQGGNQPMNVNDFAIVPALNTASVIILFLIPMISMRLFAEENRQGTMELLLTSPIRDYEIVIGKWLGAMAMYASLLLISILGIGCFIVTARPIHGHSPPALSGHASARRRAAGHRHVHLHHHAQPDCRCWRDLRRLPAALGSGKRQFFRTSRLGQR